jgi:flagellar M-ring protein FliF
MKRLNGAGTRALETVKQFTVAQRTIAIIGVAVLVLGGVALANYLGKPSYGVLYSNISDSEASGVTAQLDKDKVPYQLQGTGTILVPEASVDQERLATSSLLSSGAGGYSLLDNMGVTASEFQQNVTYKRAIEGELAKTIEAIDGVASASVQLAIPQQTVFTDDKQDPTASVFVNVSQPLTSEQVDAITHLVAAAYPGLTTDNVSVVDQKGDTLSSVGGGAAGSGSDAAADYEAATKANVQAMLDKVLGPGNAVVTVAADVSSSSGTKTSETYSAATPLQESSTSTGTGVSGAAGSTNGVSGVLGTDTTDTSTGGNSASSGSGASGAGAGSGAVISSSKNNAVNKTTTNQTIVPGTLTRQTIAVALNSSAAGKISNSALQTMVSNAAGVNLTRGDTVSVTNVPFSNSAAKAASAALAQSQKAQSAGQMTDIITTAIKVVGGIVLLVILLGLIRKLFKRPEVTAVDAGAMNIVPIGTDPALGGYAPTQQLGGFAAPGQLYAGGPGTAPTVALNAPSDPAFAQLQADVDALAGSDPNQTAEYLRALMGDRAGV